MASSLNLRQYQEGILAKLDLALHRDAPAHKNFLGMRVGGLHVLIDMTQVSEILPVPSTFPAPNAHDWFLGTANVRGNLYAITDLVSFLGDLGVEVGDGADTNSANQNDARILLLSKNIAPYTAVMIDRLIGLRSLENFRRIKAGRSDEASLAQDKTSVCFAADEFEDEDGNVWQVLDCQALVNLKAFMQAGLV